MTQINKMSIDDILKLKAVVLYVVKKCQAIDYFHIFKIIYFADREHYAIYGRRIVNDTFYALKNGPVPSFLYDAVKAVEEGTNNEYIKLISSALVAFDSNYKYIMSAKEEPDMDELSISDIEMLDKSISENKGLDFSTLSNKSHDIAWRKAWNSAENSPIDPILMAKAAGATDATIEYIKESEFFKTIASA